MRIALIIAESESGFASSFKHTARVQYEVDFESSTISDIQDNLYLLKNRFTDGLKKEVKVGWEMNLEHIEMLQSSLEQIINKYQELFYVCPLKSKVYSVTNKLRESEVSDSKAFALDVLKHVFNPIKEKKKTKQDRIKEKADNMALNRALKAHRKFKS